MQICVCPRHTSVLSDYLRGCLLCMLDTEHHVLAPAAPATAVQCPSNCSAVPLATGKAALLLQHVNQAKNAGYSKRVA
jgi:hypothetical protein